LISQRSAEHPVAQFLPCRFFALGHKVHFTVVAFWAKLPAMKIPSEFGHGRHSALSQAGRLKRPALLFLLFAALNMRSAELDTIGVTLMRQVAPTLLGNGVSVAQPEGSTGNPDAFEVNPFVVNQPESLFTWTSSSGTATNFPNAVGSESGHADGVGNNFYGPASGVASQVAHVDNYDADYFFNNLIDNALPISARIVNQSFIFANTDGSHLTTSEEQSIDASYDDYSVQYGVLFMSGAGNGGSVFPSATSYNGIGVGAFPGNSSFGPTSDGRSKPDIVAPGGVTSFSTPYVSGAAAVLLQAALSGDGGVNTNAASDNRTLKALILNGAIKPADWTNGIQTPLDARYGAGVLNAFNSWNQLRGGNHTFIESTSVTSGSAHPPGANASNESALSGWDFNSITNADAGHDRIYHYYFNLTGSSSFTATATLTWQRPHSTQQNPLPGINDLNLFLYNTANSYLILSSASTVDNVEHLYVPSLPPGRYDLQVQKNAAGEVSPNETYALAFEFFSVPLSMLQTNGNFIISWPLAPAGFQLQSTTNLTLPWSAVAASVVVDTNANQNQVTVPMTSGAQFFRLQRP
jgi:subtilase family protein